MSAFTEIEGATVLLRRNGVYRASSVHSRNSRLYAKYGNGFVNLKYNNETSVPHLMYEELSVPDTNIGSDTFGDMSIVFCPKPC